MMHYMNMLKSNIMLAMMDSKNAGYDGFKGPLVQADCVLTC